MTALPFEQLLNTPAAGLPAVTGLSKPDRPDDQRFEDQLREVSESEANSTNRSRPDPPSRESAEETQQGHNEDQPAAETPVSEVNEETHSEKEYAEQAEAVAVVAIVAAEEAQQALEPIVSLNQAVSVVEHTESTDAQLQTDQDDASQEQVTTLPVEPEVQEVDVTGEELEGDAADAKRVAKQTQDKIDHNKNEQSVPAKAIESALADTSEGKAVASAVATVSETEQGTNGEVSKASVTEAVVRSADATSDGNQQEPEQQSADSQTSQVLAENAYDQTKEPAADTTKPEVSTEQPTADAELAKQTAANTDRAPGILDRIGELPGKGVPSRSSGETDQTSGPRIDSSRFVGRVARAFQVAGERGGSLQLRLSPPELGSLRIEVSIQHGVLSASIDAETSAARNALLDNLPLLRERLAEQSIRIEKFDVDVGREQSQNQQQQFEAKDRQQNSSRPNQPQLDRNAEDGEEPQLSSPTKIAGDGNLNLLI